MYDRIEETISQAKQDLEFGQPERAIHRLEGIEHLIDGTGINTLGVAFYRVGKYQEAERCFRTAISLQPTNYLSFYYLGLSLQGQGRSAEGLEAIQTSVRIEPSFKTGQAALRRAGASQPGANQGTPEMRATPHGQRRRDPMGELVIPDAQELDEYHDRKLAKDRKLFWVPFRAMPAIVKLFYVTLFVFAFGMIATATSAIFSGVSYDYSDPRDLVGDQLDQRSEPNSSNLEDFRENVDEMNELFEEQKERLTTTTEDFGPSPEQLEQLDRMMDSLDDRPPRPSVPTLPERPSLPSRDD